MVDLTRSITQHEFGAMVGVAQQTVSDLMRRGLLAEGATAGDWLLSYCANLREVAAGRGGDITIELARERALLAREQRTRVAMQNAERSRELAPVVLIEEVLARAGSRAARILDTIVPTLRRRSPHLTADDLSIVASAIANARNTAASIRLSDLELDLGAMPESAETSVIPSTNQPEELPNE